MERFKTGALHGGEPHTKGVQIMSSKCITDAWSGGTLRRCSREAKVDGRCTQHHKTYEATRATIARQRAHRLENIDFDFMVEALELRGYRVVKK